MRTGPNHRHSGSHAWQEAISLAATTAKTLFPRTSRAARSRINWSEQVPVSASIHTQDRGMGIRLKSLLKVGSGLAALLRRRHRNGSLTIQLHDEDPVSIPCIRFDACVDDCNDRRKPLIPDPYCLMSGGYRILRNRMDETPLPPWQERLPLAFWRGATTGTIRLT